MEENKKNIQKSESFSESDLERMELLRVAHEKKGKQLEIDLEKGR